MEHLVVRSAEVNNVTQIDLRNCEVLTESLIGRLPPAFAPNTNGQSKVQVGDLVWLAQAGYGVIGTLSITRVDPIAQVQSHEDIDRLKKNPIYATLEATYWEKLREKLPKLNGRIMNFASVATVREQQFTLAEQFRLNVPFGWQQSWVVLNEAKKAELFAKRGQSVSAAMAEEEASGDYEAITPKVRIIVAQIWQGQYFGVFQEGENKLHYDHFVPKALGGPGIYAENIVPVPASMNLAKQHNVVRAFAEIAYQWKLLTEHEYKGWGHMFDDKKTVIEQQREHVKKITAEIRNRPKDEQRKFYFQILEKGIGPIVRQLFDALQAVPPGT